jgi:hypothetical protein
MHNLARSLAALSLGAASVFVAGLPASATTDPCLGQDTGYGASNVCVVNVVAATPLCPAPSALQLSYAVTVTGTELTTVDLHWLVPGGSDVVQAGQPLTGTVDWPTAVPQATTDVTFVAGAQSTVSVNPTAALASDTCTSESGVLPTSPSTPVSNDVPAESQAVAAVSAVAPAPASGVLAVTGAEVLPYAVGAGGLLLAGTALVLIRSRRVHQ